MAPNAKRATKVKTALDERRAYSPTVGRRLQEASVGEYAHPRYIYILTYSSRLPIANVPTVLAIRLLAHR